MNLDKKEIDFIGKRKIFLIISVILIILSLLIIGFKGLDFGTEFTGGTTITLLNTQDKSEAEVKEAIKQAGYKNEPIIQTLSSGNSTGFLIQTSTIDVQESEQIASKTAEILGVPSENSQVSTIGPNWGTDIIQASVTAMLVSFIIIIAYIWIRFRDYKMGISAVISLIHDIIIVIGIYALFGREVTPNAVAALLTIMGFSLYDTIVVFHRINDNIKENKIKHSFWTVANHSINQVFTRTINTTLVSIIPVLAMLLFGGNTLQDFAFAMAIGLICGSYSSIAIATPIYSYWKRKEPNYINLEKQYGTKTITDTKKVLAGFRLNTM